MKSALIAAVALFALGTAFAASAFVCDVPERVTLVAPFLKADRCR
jgi:hypothetical protein